jgi:hypothetical protein
MRRRIDADRLSEIGSLVPPQIGVKLVRDFEGLTYATRS